MLPSCILPAAPDLISLPVPIPVAGLQHVAGLLAGMLA